MRIGSNQQFVFHVARVTIFWNIILSLGKFIAGITACSSAMLSDAVHSASDVFSTFIVMAGVKMAGKQPDKEHPYGHERMECVAALLLAFVLFTTGIGIGAAGLQKIIAQNATPLIVPGQLALAAAAVSIVVKEAMYWYTRSAAKKINSSALMADAWHHRSDAFSSIGSFIGILGARLGYPILDPLASICICMLIMKAALDIFIDAINKMTDRACDEQLFIALTNEIRTQTGVHGIDRLNTRLFGNKIYVDVEISACGDLPLSEAHAIAQQVHDAVERSFPDVKHCMVHVNPDLARGRRRR